MEKLNMQPAFTGKEKPVCPSLLLYATYISALALAACAPYQEKTHAGPLAGPSFHDSKKPGDMHPPFLGHSHSHPYSKVPHTHKKPYMMDGEIGLCNGDGTYTWVKNPTPTLRNYPPTNNIERAQPVRSAVPESAEPLQSVYTVQPGDTAGAIAQRFNLPFGKLGELNPGLDLNTIRVGQMLNIR